MEILAEYKGRCLLRRYGRPYVRFWGGRDEEMPCEFPVAEEEAQRAQAAPEVIQSLIDGYKRQVEWDAETFYRIGIVECLRHQVQMTRAQAEEAYAGLVRQPELRKELYDSIMGLREAPGEGLEKWLAGLPSKDSSPVEAGAGPI